MAGDIVGIPFFADHEIMLLHWKQLGVNINPERSANTIKRLRVSIKTKRPRKLTNVVILLHDNARPRVGLINWEVTQHPPNSIDFSRCDFYVFNPLKKLRLWFESKLR